jgi:signal peptidase II
MPPSQRSCPPRALRLGVGVLAVDQTTKLAAPLVADGPLGSVVMPMFNDEFTLGVAAAPVGPTVLAAIVMLVVFGGYAVHLARDGRLPWWSPALLIAGALGNLIDRVALGAVRDFLVTPWAIINVADVAVVVGLVAYLTMPLRRSRATRDRRPTGGLPRPGRKATVMHLLRAHCPSCLQQIEIPAGVCALLPGLGQPVAYAFACPYCGEQVVRAADSPTLSSLDAAGASASGPRERDSGPAHPERPQAGPALAPTTSSTSTSSWSTRTGSSRSSPSEHARVVDIGGSRRAG